MVKIHQFYKKLLFNIDSLATLGKLDTIQGAALLVIIRKPELLKSELMTHVTGDWSDWTDRGTDKCATAKRSSTLPQGRAFQSHDRNANKYLHGVFIVTKCLHQQNIKILMQRKLCFNCLAGQHSGNTCKSKMSCQLCHKRHQATSYHRTEDLQLHQHS